ncbi:hypothetical protein [Catenulispora rubra]|uniref:hypothetical protein n=1 Tax=Catenulispora rubra TaxID=280293 RepID=UPI001892777D|nr:hypothetical protein [Catenulispora rubra]
MRLPKRRPAGPVESSESSEPVTYAVIETPDGAAHVNVQFVEEPGVGMFVIVPSAGIRRELAALDAVLVSIGQGLPEGLSLAELAWSEVLRTRPRRARLVLNPELGVYMLVEWLDEADVLTGAGAVAELALLAVRHG